MNSNIQGDFQICINVPFRLLMKKIIVTIIPTDLLINLPLYLLFVLSYKPKTRVKFYDWSYMTEAECTSDSPLGSYQIFMMNFLQKIVKDKSLILKKFLMNYIFQFFLQSNQKFSFEEKLRPVRAFAQSHQ